LPTLLFSVPSNLNTRYATTLSKVRGRLSLAAFSRSVTASRSSRTSAAE
jgi:hypothetical protein